MFSFFKKKEEPREEVKTEEINTNDYKNASGLLSSNMNPGELDINSQTWAYLTNYILKRLVKLRQLNDNPKISHEQAQVLRGGLKELKLILRLPQQDENKNSSDIINLSETMTGFKNHF